MAPRALSEVAACHGPRKGHPKSLRAATLLAPAVFAAALWSLRETSSPKEAQTIFRSSNPKVVAIVQSSMPGAVSSYELLPKVLKALRPFNIKPKDTIYGQSICSDEINNEKGQISTLLSNYYGKVFPMGGIGGAPFVGRTGFGAFSAHVPDNGHVFVLFGPHIGFSPNSEAGKFLRIGQSRTSTACGAVIAAYNQVTSGTVMADDPFDIEQSWLRNKLKAHAGDIAKSSNLMVELVLRAYQEIEKEVLTIVNTKFGPGKLILLGGIQINMPYPTPGFFLPLHFTIRSERSGAVDLLPTIKRV